MSDAIAERGEGESRERRVIRAALFTALSVALGFLLAAVPNVELITLSVFLGGVFCGPRVGAVVGALSEALFSLLNPLGPALPPLFAAQIACFALTGLAGGLLAPLLRPAGRASVAASALAGFVLTAIYEALTNAATALIALGPRRLPEGIGGVYAAGALFTAVHVGVNTAVFAAAVVPVVRVARAWRKGGGR